MAGNRDLKEGLEAKLPPSEPADSQATPSGNSKIQLRLNLLERPTCAPTAPRRPRTAD